MVAGERAARAGVAEALPPQRAIAFVAQRAAGAQLLEDAVAFCGGQAFGVLQRDRGQARELDVLGVAWSAHAGRRRRSRARDGRGAGTGRRAMRRRAPSGLGRQRDASR